MFRLLAVIPLALAIVSCSSTFSTAIHNPGTIETPPEFKVAFVGDSGINGRAVAVLELIRDEGADMVLHQGDLWYGSETDPQLVAGFDAQIDRVLGADFPYFASIGNHDVRLWPEYQELLSARIDRIPGAQCTSADQGIGVKSSCTYNGLSFLLLGAGTQGSGFDSYIQQELSQSDSIWRLCTWHKNQSAMQVGGKSGEVGWGPYEHCRAGSAIIATGHEHSYSRTRTLTDMSRRSVDPAWPEADTIRVGNGSSFVFVSGLGGRSIRDQERCLPVTFPYGCNGEWASIYTADQGATNGALFIEFNVDGDPRLARGYFKNVDGEIIDTFTVSAATGS